MREGNVPAQDQRQKLQFFSQLQDANFLAGNAIFCDAAWEQTTGTSRAGLGIVITMQGNQHLKQLHVSALSPPASSPLQAETYGLLLATKLAHLLQVQDLPLLH